MAPLQNTLDENFILIEPDKIITLSELFEFWYYRELLFFFIWRDIKIRYKQTFLGFTWVIIQPLFMILVFTYFFGELAKVPSEGVPYPLFSFAGLLPWNLFTEGLNRSTTTMITNAQILTKVYFPRIIMPLAGIISPMIDFAIAFGIFTILMLYFGYIPGINLVLLPLLVLLVLGTALGVGLWLSALNVLYRDFQYTLPFLIQLGFFLSPVVYPSTLIPERFEYLYALNPMSGIIDGFRWVLLGTNPPGFTLLISIGVIILLIISGIIYFKRMERYFADVV